MKTVITLEFRDNTEAATFVSTYRGAADLRMLLADGTTLVRESTTRTLAPEAPLPRTRGRSSNERRQMKRTNAQRARGRGASRIDDARRAEILRFAADTNNTQAAKKYGVSVGSIRNRQKSAKKGGRKGVTTRHPVLAQVANGTQASLSH